MILFYPSLEYEINTQIREYRELKGYTQEEFAFLIGRSKEDVQSYEDLNSPKAYNLNFLNFYARILGCVPSDLIFTDSIPEDEIKLSVTKTEYKTKTVYRGERILDKGIRIRLAPYEISKLDIPVVALEQDRMLTLLNQLLLDDYFKDGKTGYELYLHCITLWDSEFRIQILINALAILSGRRRGRKLLPMRKAPKTAEKWLLYKEDY